MKPLLPKAMLINKSYTDDFFHSREDKEQFVHLLRTLGSRLGVNQQDGHSLFCDDMILWFRNLFFLSDEGFQRCLSEFKDDHTLLARIWRIYFLCWAALNSRRINGSILDIGCYNAKTTKIFLRYSGLLEDLDRRILLYDLFEAPPKESRKGDHGPELYSIVKDRFASYNNIDVIGGSVFETVRPEVVPLSIAFCQIDLNDAQAESHVFRVIYPRLSPGAMVIFDDFGFLRYRESAECHRALLTEMGLRPELIIELPTGQGLFIR